jgi:hypothetical protein
VVRAADHEHRDAVLFLDGLQDRAPLGLQVGVDDLHRLPPLLAREVALVFGEFGPHGTGFDLDRVRRPVVTEIRHNRLLDAAGRGRSGKPGRFKLQGLGVPASRDGLAARDRLATFQGKRRMDGHIELGILPPRGRLPPYVHLGRGASTQVRFELAVQRDLGIDRKADVGPLRACRRTIDGNDLRRAAGIAPQEAGVAGDTIGAGVPGGGKIEPHGDDPSDRGSTDPSVGDGLQEYREAAIETRIRERITRREDALERHPILKFRKALVR